MSWFVNHCELGAGLELVFYFPTRLTFAHFLRANDQIDAKEEATAMTAAKKALMLQACPPAPYGPLALV